MTSILNEYLYKPRYKIWLIRKFQNSLQVVKKVSKRKIKTIMKIGGKKRTLDKNNPALVFENKYFFFIDIDSGNSYVFTENNYPLNPDELDMVIGCNVLKELSSGVIDDKRGLLINIGIGIAIGVMIGFVIMNLIMNGKLNDLHKYYRELMESDPIIFP